MDRPGCAPDRQLDIALEGIGAAALGKGARERDLRVVLDVEEVRAPQMRIPIGLARPHPGRVDDAFKRRVEASLPIELEPAVDVLQQAPHPRDHHVPGAKLRLGVPGFKDPGRHLGRCGPERTGPGGQDPD